MAAGKCTRALSTILKIGGGVAKVAPLVAFAEIGVNMATHQQVTVGDTYQTLVTGASVFPGWGLIARGGALAVEAASYYFTGRSVSDNINRQLNGGVITVGNNKISYVIF